MEGGRVSLTPLYKERITIKINYRHFHLSVLSALQPPNTSVLHGIYFVYTLKYSWAPRFRSQLSFHFTVYDIPWPSPPHPPIAWESDNQVSFKSSNLWLLLKFSWKDSSFVYDTSLTGDSPCLLGHQLLHPSSSKYRIQTLGSDS